jgi:hypothetical protein
MRWKYTGSIDRGEARRFERAQVLWDAEKFDALEVHGFYRPRRSPTF